MKSNSYVTLGMDGIPYINTIKLAEIFNKRPSTIHKEIANFSGNEKTRNEYFIEKTYIDKKGFEQQCYEITLEGFGHIADIFKKLGDDVIIEAIHDSFREYDVSNEQTLWEIQRELKKLTKQISDMCKQLFTAEKLTR